MADDFGLKIGIEGEKEFKNALKDINQTFKVLGSEMNLVSSQFDKQDKSIGALTARNQVLNKEIETQKDKISTLDKALQNAAASFGESDKRTKAWQIQLNNANADLNKMQRELDDNNKSLNITGKEFNETEKKIGQFGKEIQSAADKTDNASVRFEKIGGIIKGIGAVIGTAVVAIGTATVGAAKSLADMTINASKYADNILTISSVTGMSTQSLQAYQYAAELVDVSMETLTGSMSKQIKSMSNARDGSSKFADAYSKLGVSVSDTNGQLRDSDTVYWETIDALGKISNETERDALAMQIFGKSAQELNPLIAQGSIGIAELTEEAKRMGAVMSEDSLKALGKFDDSMQRLKSGAGAAKNMLGMVLLPQLQVLADDGIELIGDFTKGLADANGDWNKISVVIGATIGELTNVMMGALPEFTQVGLDIITSIGDAILDNLPNIIDAAVSIVITLLESIIGALPQISQGAVELVLALVNGILDNLPTLVQGALLMIVALATGLSEALPELIPAIVEAVILIVETIINNMDKVLEAAYKIVIGLSNGLINALPVLIEALPNIITSITDFIINNLPMIIEMGVNINAALVSGLLAALPQLVASLPQIVFAILNGIGKAVTAVVDIGRNIVFGVWQGIQSMASWLYEQVSNFFSSIVNRAKSVLGIKSPSRVFAEIGVNMAEGVGVGFQDAMNNVSKQIQSSIPIEMKTDVNTTISTNIVNGLVGGLSSVIGSNSQVSKPITLQVVLDSKVIAQTIFNPLKEVSRQRGVALG